MAYSNHKLVQFHFSQNPDLFLVIWSISLDRLWGALTGLMLSLQQLSSCKAYFLHFRATLNTRQVSRSSSVSVLSNSLQPHGLQHTRPPFLSPTPGACSNSSNSCPSSWSCHPIISSSVVPFSYCPQSFPASGSFPVNQFFASGGQSIGVSASVLPMNIQDWFPLGWADWLSLQTKGLSTVFSNTTVPKHQFSGAQLSL